MGDLSWDKSVLYFGRLEHGVWSLEIGYKRGRGPEEGFDPEVNWHWLATFAGWESEGEP